MLKVVTHIDFSLVGDGEDSKWSGGYTNPDGVEPTQVFIIGPSKVIVPVPAKAVGVLIVVPSTVTTRGVNINGTDNTNTIGTLGFWGPVKFPSAGFVTSLACVTGAVGGEYWTFYWL
jgi:hypothetical protein